jgi:hypothetical protein
MNISNKPYQSTPQYQILTTIQFIVIREHYLSISYQFKHIWHYCCITLTVSNFLLSSVCCLATVEDLRLVVCVSALVWFIRYIHFWNLQFLNNVNYYHLSIAPSRQAIISWLVYSSFCPAI